MGKSALNDEPWGEVLLLSVRISYGGQSEGSYLHASIPSALYRLMAEVEKQLPSL